MLSLLIPRPRQFDRTASAHLPTLLVDPLRDGEIGRGSSIVVRMERDLFGASAACKCTVEDFSEFMDLVPGNDAFFDWIENSGLTFLLDQFAPIRDDEIRAPDCLVVVLAASLLQPSAFDQGAVGTHDSHEMLPQFRAMFRQIPARWNWLRRSQRQSPARPLLESRRVRIRRRQVSPCAGKTPFCCQSCG